MRRGRLSRNKRSYESSSSSGISSFCDSLSLSGRRKRGGNPWSCRSLCSSCVYRVVVVVVVRRQSMVQQRVLPVMGTHTMEPMGSSSASSFSSSSSSCKSLSLSQDEEEGCGNPWWCVSKSDPPIHRVVVGRVLERQSMLKKVAIHRRTTRKHWNPFQCSCCCCCL